MYLIALHLILLLTTESNCQDSTTPPHIIYINADDLGWNDGSFHGAPDVPTPNIDALALNGIMLNNYYAEWLCTPSRGALMTGLYPIRLGLQHSIIKAGERSALPLNLTILPQHLKNLGYETHMVGKWHLGYYETAYTPTKRGFDSFYGYLNGVLDYFDYTNCNDGRPRDNISDPVFFGIDLYNGTEPIRDFRGEYAATNFGEKAKDVILAHDSEKPLFLYLPQIAVHSSASYSLLQAPSEAVSQFMYIKDQFRRIYAGITYVLDQTVGLIFEALHQKDMLKNSVVVFVSDNGAELDPEIGGYGTNYPLRGNKETLWEGGIKVPGLIWSPLLQLKEQRISTQFMHVSDWLPTFYSLAGGDVSDLGEIDGYDMWDALLKDLPSPRTDLLHNIDPIDQVSAYRAGDLKVINGTASDDFNGWRNSPSGHRFVSPESMEQWVFKNGSVIRDILNETGLWIAQDPDEWYRQAEVVCQQPPPENASLCNPNVKPCLFNVTADPCEYYDLADELPELLNDLWDRVLYYQSVAVEPQSKPNDPHADPACHNFTYVPWMDPEHYSQCTYLSE